jgi:type IV secretion system protein VirD4
MFRLLEKFLLEGLLGFYSLENVFPALLLGAVALVLFFLQFLNQKKTIVPGVIGLVFALLAFQYLFLRENVISQLELIILGFDMPRENYSAIPLLEPIFSIMVAPLEYRSPRQEILFVLISTYLAFVCYHGYLEYKKTGMLLGDLSFGGILKGEGNRPLRSKSNELGSGDLANTEQIAVWTRPNGNLDTVLPVTDLRGSEGTVFKHSKLVIPNGERNRHMLAVAKTGSGKTTRLILPILYNDCLCPTRSTIVLDSKPEMWRKLAAMTRTYNPDKHIMLFNPLDRARSLSWNILSKIEDDTDAKLIANTIIMATDQPQSKSDSPFFRNNALAILNAIMVGLLHDPNETLSMPRIHELVQSGMKPLCDWLEAHPHALRNSRTFIELARSGSQNADTIMSELGMRLSAWDLTAIRATTSADELNIEALIERPTLFIIELRESELEMLRPMANVIVVEILRYLTKRAESCPNSTLPRPVGLVIDEFASALGRLPDIHVKLNTLRSRNVSIVAAIQSIAQIKANYGDDADSVLAGFSTKIMMPALDLQDAEWASKETGQMTIRFKTASTGSNRKLVEWFASKNDGTQEQVQQRAVLTPDEIGRPADNINTFFMPNTPVFQGFLTPFYKVPEMLKRITEFDNDTGELKLRAAPIKFEEKLPDALNPAAKQNGTATAAGGLPPGISDTTGWGEDKIVSTLNETKKKLDWDNTTGSARKWWEAFENENNHRKALILRLAEELAVRKATITEFFLAYVYSNTDNIQANLFYLDYTRLKKEEEKKKRETATKQASASQASSTTAASTPSPSGPNGTGSTTALGGGAPSQGV